jgi:hypothetical protein
MASPFLMGDTMNGKDQMALFYVDVAILRRWPFLSIKFTSGAAGRFFLRVMTVPNGRIYLSLNPRLVRYEENKDWFRQVSFDKPPA